MTDIGEPLTVDEHRLLDMISDVFNLFTAITGRGLSRDGDMIEIAHHVHALQDMVLAQAAARAYPRRYRLLGEMVLPREREES